MVEVRTLGARERLPQTSDYVVIVELRQRSGAVFFIVNGSVIGDPDVTSPSEAQFRDFQAALSEAKRFARAYNLPCVYFRPVPEGR